MRNASAEPVRKSCCALSQECVRVSNAKALLKLPPSRCEHSQPSWRRHPPQTWEAELQPTFLARFRWYEFSRL